MFISVADSHGNVPPELEPIHLLAWAASGYVIWQNSTENTHFHLAQVKHVKQVVSNQQEQDPTLVWAGGTLKLIPFSPLHSPGCSKPVQAWHSMDGIQELSSCGKNNKLNEQNSVNSPSFAVFY